MKKIISCLLTITLLLSCNYIFCFAEGGWFDGDIKIWKSNQKFAEENPGFDYQNDSNSLSSNEEEGYFERMGSTVGTIGGIIGGAVLGTFVSAPIHGGIAGGIGGNKAGKSVGKVFDSLFK